MWPVDMAVRDGHAMLVLDALRSPSGFAVNYRAQGYATRDPSPTRADSPDRFGALSVPIFLEGWVIACISISWLPAVAGESEIARAYLVTLRDAAASIEERLRRSHFAVPPLPRAGA